MDKEIPDEFNCPICLDVAYPPMMTSCGHLFCESCSNKIKECSVCRKTTIFIPAYSIKSFIDNIVLKKKEYNSSGTYQKYFDQVRLNELEKSKRVKKDELDRVRQEELDRVRRKRLKRLKKFKEEKLDEVRRDMLKINQIIQHEKLNNLINL